MYRLNMYRLKNNQKAFTLLEILAGIVILGLISIPLLNYFTQSMVTAGRTRDQGEAVTLASTIMEQAVYIVRNADDFDDILDDLVDNFDEFNAYEVISNENTLTLENGHDVELSIDEKNANLVEINIEVNDGQYELRTLRHVSGE